MPQLSLRPLAVIFVLFAALSTHASTLHIVIDPGHGGADDGAIRGKVREASIALNVAKNLAALLKADSRFQVTLTRDSDHTVTLPERKKIARAAHADLFVSIHANASNDPRAQGVEFYFQNQMPADEETMFLANRENMTSDADEVEKSDEPITQKGDVAHIVEDLKRNYRASASNDLSRLLLDNWENGKNRHNRRPIRQAPFFVVSDAAMPAVLVELGFVSNSKDSVKLTSPDYQNQMARNLFDGLVQFKTAFDRDSGKNESVAAR